MPGKSYIVNRDSGTVSVCYFTTHLIHNIISYGCGSYKKHIVVGRHPGPIAATNDESILYIGYPESGTVSVINGFTDKVAVGVIFNVNPSDSGVIKCNGITYPTNTYIYVDSGTNCTAQNGKGFEFNTWAESPLTNRNSSTPIEQSAISGSPWNSFLITLGMKPNDTSATLDVDKFAIFTANFKLPHHLTTEELLGWLTVAISAAVAVNGVILLVPGWRRARKQRTHLRECIKIIDEDVDKSHKNVIEDKIMGYYVDGKLSEDHRQLLKDKISEYYGTVKGSESGA